MVLCGFVYNFTQIVHLFFIKRVRPLSFLEDVVEVPPQFFTNLHLSLQEELEVSRDLDLVIYRSVTHALIPPLLDCDN